MGVYHWIFEKSQFIITITAIIATRTTIVQVQQGEITLMYQLYSNIT
jgi:hypothetical protein